jgi:hypothetical protein
MKISPGRSVEERQCGEKKKTRTVIQMCENNNALKYQPILGIVRNNMSSMWG